MDDFKALGLPAKLEETLDRIEFHTPTPIQAQAIPHALLGKDILGSAQTGTGKTGAFGIPLVAKLLSDSRGSALVLTPTRELAVQVLEQLKLMLGKRSFINTALLIGGDSMPKQIQALRNRPRLLVGTPGRINDHLERGTLMLHDAKFLVLDETDRMLDMGFTIQIEQIMKFLPKVRQTLLFSATLPNNIIKISKKYLTDPVRVAADSVSSVAKNIDQEVMEISDGDKYPEFLQQLAAREGSIIVFIKTKHGTDRMAEKLRKKGHKAAAIHGDLRQNQRDRVIREFREKKYRILVATDVAARGLDIPHIEHVINYDLPQAPEDYIHRIGRTARAGADGSSLCFVTPTDRLKWKAIERLLDGDESPERKPKRNKKPSGSKPSSNARPNRDKPSGEKRPERKQFKDRSNDNGDAKPSGKKPFRKKPDGEKRSFGEGKSSGGERSGSSDRKPQNKTRRPHRGKPAQGGGNQPPKRRSKPE